MYGDSQATNDDDTFKDFQSGTGRPNTPRSTVLSGRAVDKALKEKLVKMEKATSRLPLLQSHDAMSLLRYSISVPKLHYTRRMSDFSENAMPTYFDTFQRQCISDIINVDINEFQWTQATLSIRDDGLGICSITMFASSAFLAWATSILQIQNDILSEILHDVTDSSIDKANSSWKAKSNIDIPRHELRNKQKEWDKVITKKNINEQ